jgi:hypothetical protein
MKLIKAILAEALEQCITCPGTGWMQLGEGRTGRVWCPDCKGTGKMLTDDGQELVEFLRKRLGHFAEADHTHSIH